jgi:hypothetical protein
MSFSPEICATCQSKLNGNFCSQCGEQRLNQKLRSLHYIISDIIQDLTSVDGKFYKTIKTILVHPGELEYHYHIGKRVCYLKPITLFFILNVLFVMVSPISDFYVTLDDQISLQGYSPYIKPLFEDYLLEKKISYQAFEQNYNQLVVVLARSLIILEVPIFALACSAVLYNRKYYSGDYFNFSLNLHSWLLMWIIIAMAPAFIFAIFIYLLELTIDANEIYYLILPIGLGAYLFFAMRRMFRLTWWQSLWRLFLLLPAYAISHILFRFIQFLLTASLVEV